MACSYPAYLKIALQMFVLVNFHGKQTLMSGGSTIVGPWPNRESDVVAPIPAPVEETGSDWVHGGAIYEEEAPPPRRKFPIIIKSLCVILAMAWVGFSLWTQYLALGGEMPTMREAAAFVPVVATPLILLGLIWIIIARSAQAEGERITRTINDLRAEEARFGLILDSFNAKINQGRDSIVEQNDLLMTLGIEAANRLTQISSSVRSEVDGIAKHSTTLRASASSARADMAVLLSDLPKAQVQTRQMTAALKEAGISAHEQAGALDAQLASLISRGREAEEVAGGAAQKLAAHLTRMEGVSETAGLRMTEAAGQMTDAVDSALQRAADALESARSGMEAQGAAMLAMVEQGHSSMASTGAESANIVSQRMAEVQTRVDAVAKTFADQDSLSKTMLDRVANDVTRIEERIAALGDGAVAASGEAGTALQALENRVNALGTSLKSGGDTTEAMIRQAELLLTALDATGREIDESLPAAFERLKAFSDKAEKAARAITPQFAAIDTASSGAVERLLEAETLLKAQREGLDALMATATARLAESRTSAEELAQALEGFEDKAKTLTDATGPQLIEALLRVKDTANQAADHARTTIHAVIPASAQALAEQSRTALTNALTQQVEEQVANIAATTETAVAAAQKATDRLMRQMLTISETAAALETRVQEAKQDIASSDEGAFARRMSLLIESLNSTAIDVTKVLSNDVTDTAWSAYLRGDRGVFTRRAVRLLDNGEVREIGRRYDEDVEFREQVNRYIHDFEGMLRHVLASRDGDPLSVTLLSSDAGKLYVALAQAIDRLRN
jgi:hypothetical protein